MIICRKEKMPTALVPLYGLQVLVKKKSSILVLTASLRTTYFRHVILDGYVPQV